EQRDQAEIQCADPTIRAVSGRHRVSDLPPRPGLSRLGRATRFRQRARKEARSTRVCWDKTALPMPEAERPSPGIYLGLFLTTLATLMFEILLTRIFSVTMWY